MVKKELGLGTVIVVALIVAVIASLITANITGNVIKVRAVQRGTQVYTKAEIDRFFNNSLNITKNMIYHAQRLKDNLPSCKDVCNTGGLSCILGQLTTSDPESENGKIIDCFEDYSHLNKTNYTLNCICSNP